MPVSSAPKIPYSTAASMHVQQTKRRVPRISKVLARQVENRIICVFNVGPWSWSKNMGSGGTLTVPKCPKGMPYAVLTPLIQESIPDSYPRDNEGDMETFFDDGRETAEQFVGIGIGQRPADSFEQYGVAIAEGTEPTNREIKRANDNLDAFCKAKFQEISSASKRGQKSFDEAFSPMFHPYAAERINRTDVEWLKNTVIAVRNPCPACGTVSEVGVVICPSCKGILDEAKFDSPEFQRMWKKSHPGA